MTTATIAATVSKPQAMRMASIPGSVRFTYPAREVRTGNYRTWLGRKGMGWCWECLLCGEWRSSAPAREAAVVQARDSHPGWCHVRTGCSCRYPHLTVAMTARLGIDGQEYPAHLGPVLLRMAGAIRKPCAPCFDRHGTQCCETAWRMIAEAGKPLFTSQASTGILPGQTPYRGQK